MADDDDGLVLNLAMPEGAGPLKSRTQQRKQKWTQQRAFKVGTLPVAARMPPGSALTRAYCCQEGTVGLS
jgi:hypothetical protein